MDDPPDPPRLSSGPARLLWLLVGLASLGLGLVGVVVPGLPTTIFLIIAAGCFARSSPRLEQWVLDLPRVGQAVRDHLAGLGMPRRAKAWAIGMITLACGLSAGILIEPTWVRLLVAVVGLVGISYVGWRVPTRERVLGTG